MSFKRITHCAPNDVGDLHEMVIHDIGQMVGRVSVGLEQNGIIINTFNKIQLVRRAVLPCLAVHQVLEDRIAFNL